MSKELKLRILSSIILIPFVFFIILKGSHLFTVLLIICFFISIYEWSKLGKSLLVKLFGFTFLFFSFYSVYMLRNDALVEYKIIFFVLIVCIATDIGGYVFGNIFKGPKLIKISPNKTYSGMIGSFVFSFTAVLIFLNFFEFQNLFKTNIVTYTIVFLISLVSQIGDLVISYFKRINHIKDTGKFIPGHGGILDRIDGMVFAFPFFYFLLFSNFIKL